MKSIPFLVLVLLSFTTFAQVDSVSIHSKNAANYKAPSSVSNSRWFFTYWEEQYNYKYIYSNGRLVKKSTFSKTYNDTSEIQTYSYDADGYLIRSDYYNIFKRGKMELYGYNTYERSADKKNMRQKIYTWYDQYNGVALYTITDYKYDERNEIISTHERQLWLSDSSYRTSNFHSENRIYLNNKSKKYLQRIDSTYDNFANVVIPSYKYLFVYDHLERIRIILRYGYQQNEWQLLNKDSLVYKSPSDEPHEYHRISYTNESSLYFSNMKWNNFKSVDLVGRLYNLSYFEYDLYSYNQIVKSVTGDDTIIKRVGNKLDNFGSTMYYEYRRDINNKLVLRTKFAEYYDIYKNQQLSYYRQYDNINNVWLEMIGRLSLNEYNQDQTVKSTTYGNLYGDSAIFYTDRFEYFDYVDAVLGINQHNTLNIGIYPNPFKNQLYIDGQGAKIENLTIRNILGETLYSLPNVEERTIDLSELSPGIYYLSITVNQSNYSYKIIKASKSD